MAENAPYRIRNVVPAKNTKSATCSPIDFQNTSPYPSDWNQRRSTQYDSPTRPKRKTPKAKAAKKMILRRRLHTELRCCGESTKSGNFPPYSIVIGKHSDCRLLINGSPHAKPFHRTNALWSSVIPSQKLYSSPRLINLGKKAI